MHWKHIYIVNEYSNDPRYFAFISNVLRCDSILQTNKEKIYGLILLHLLKGSFLCCLYNGTRLMLSLSLEAISKVMKLSSNWRQNMNTEMRQSLLVNAIRWNSNGSLFMYNYCITQFLYYCNVWKIIRRKLKGFKRHSLYLHSTFLSAWNSS